MDQRVLVMPACSYSHRPHQHLYIWGSDCDKQPVLAIMELRMTPLLHSVKTAQITGVDGITATINDPGAASIRPSAAIIILVADCCQARSARRSTRQISLQMDRRHPDRAESPWVSRRISRLCPPE